MSEEHNSDAFLRPRFRIDVTGSEEMIVSKFESKLNSDACLYTSKIVDNHIFIDVPVEEAHYWSPHLHLEIEVASDNLTWVKGLFTPKPQVWTLFMFLHLIVGLLFFIFLVMWYVRWTLDGETLFPMSMTMVLPVIWIGLYFFGRWGRRQGKSQINELHQFMMKTLEKEIAN